MATIRLCAATGKHVVTHLVTIVVKQLHTFDWVITYLCHHTQPTLSKPGMNLYCRPRVMPVSVKYFMNVHPMKTQTTQPLGWKHFVRILTH